MSVLLIKVTVLFLAGLAALLVTKRATAATRHLLCLCALAGSLLLPLAALLPLKTIVFQARAIGAVETRSPAILRVAELAWSSFIPGLWALGTVLFLLRLALGYRRLARLLRAASPIDPPIYATDVSVPIVSGLIRPAVLLPLAATEWPEWQRAAAVHHEMAHLQRKDLWANLAANLACALYWFHPLVWALKSHLRREQETACDDSVLQSGFEPATYAEALLAVAKDFPSTLLPGCSMTTKANLKSRTIRVLDSSIARTTSRATLLRTAAVFTGIVFAIAALRPVLAQNVYQAGGDVTSPRIIFKVDPQYSKEARENKIEGTLILSFVVGTDGLGHGIRVEKSLDPGLDRAGAEAVEQWRFVPGTLRGETLPVELHVEINFKPIPGLS